MKVEARTGCGESESRSKPELTSGVDTSVVAGCWVSSFAELLTGTTGASGGNSRTGEPEQFGPWQGGCVGCSDLVACSTPCGVVVSIAAVEFAEGRMVTYPPHPADACSGVAHATTTSSSAARQPRNSEGRGENMVRLTRREYVLPGYPDRQALAREKSRL